ncbi:MAG: DUF4175 family protein [Hyphomonadaceae bacterium]|nr:DUF4175 family protein [Hyphomonadaceae bacterium]
MQHSDALELLARETARARRALFLERLARAILLPLGAFGLWIAISLSGLPELLPPLAQTLIGIAALLGVLWLCLRAFVAWRAPTDAEARARLASDSALDPAAFDALEDRPSRLDAFSLELWKAEIGRAAERAARAQARPPRPGLDRADPWKLRFVLAIALVSAAFVAGPALPDRLARALLPDPGPLVGDQPMVIEAWLAPADYTDAAPVSLSDRIGERIASPPSVEANVRVAGPRGAPRLIFESSGRREEALFTRAADGAYEARLRIPRAGTLKIVRFHTKAHWRIEPARDAPPRIDFTAPIAFRAEERATLAWTATDDYGVRELALRVTPVHPPEGLVGAAPVDTPIESPAGDPRKTEDDATVTLADHPYAGMEVEARLVARDALGQEGVSAPMRVKLPEKVFLQPLAQAAIEIRRMVLFERRAYRRMRAAPGGPATMAAGDILTGTERIVIRTDDQDPRLERAPIGIRRAVRWIDALTSSPRDGYFADFAVFLGFQLSRSALAAAREIIDTDGAAEILWLTALRAEYGGAADARRALEEAQRALNDALQSGASQDRIEQLTQALRRAMNNYLQALVQEAMRSGQQQTQEDTQEQTEFSQRDLDDVLKEIERLNREGQTEAAQAMLQQLANLLQNLDIRLQQGQNGQQSAQGQEQGEPSDLEQNMQDLSETMGQQRQLSDDTQRQGDEGGGQQQAQGLAERQSELREGLERARRAAERAGSGQEQALGKADNAMRQAEQALRQGDFEAARMAQEEAMRNLREGAASLAEEIERRSQAENGERESDSAGRDPLGRVRGGVGDTGETQVPSEMQRARSREILDELRRRAQDPRRPETERDYLRRLLDRFTGS